MIIQRSGNNLKKNVFKFHLLTLVHSIFVFPLIIAFFNVPLMLNFRVSQSLSKYVTCNPKDKNKV